MDDYESTAQELLRVLDAVEASEFQDRSLIQEAQRLHALLKPVYEQVFGAFPLIQTNYPPRIWFPRAREWASQALAAAQAGWLQGAPTEQPTEPARTEEAVARADETQLAFQVPRGDSGLTCFVIGPIGDPFAPVASPTRDIWEESVRVYEEVIQPACDVNGLHPVRSDELAVPGEVTEQVCILLRDCDVVVADLTGANPNVMYELGLRHSRGGVTIQIGEAGRLPFDINVIRTEQFIRSRSGLIDARERLKSALEQALAGNFLPVTASRVFEPGLPASGAPGLPPGRAESETRSVESAPSHPTTSQLEEPGLLDLVAEAEELFPVVTEQMNRIGEIVHNIGETVRSFTPKMERATTSAQKLALVRQMSNKLEPDVNDLEGVATEYAVSVDRLDTAVTYSLGYISSAGVALPEGTEDFLSRLVGLKEQATPAIASIQQFAGSLDTSSGLSRDMRRVFGRASRAMRGVAGVSSRVAEWGTTAEALVEHAENGDD